MRMPTVLFLIALGVLCVAYAIGQVRARLAARRASRRPVLGDLLYLARRVADGAPDGELCYVVAYYGARIGQRARRESEDGWVLTPSMRGSTGSA